tara:strand:- start:344 stop:538 length:195 start_codon:yes stop_codon:yes gene_type:complete
MNMYKSKSVTLRTETHDKLSNLSRHIVSGLELSIPNTIDLLVNEKINGSKDRAIKGTNEENKKA